jgi:putative intracellular protease/amidase
MKKISSWLIGSILVSYFLVVSCSNEHEIEPKINNDIGKKILMFVPFEMAYYTEYIVMYEALTASGYNVDVMSAATSGSGVYMLPVGTTVEETANTLPGSNHTEFKQQFKSMFGSDWNENLNSIPPTGKIEVHGKIQTVENMDNYLGLVVVGGTGILSYRLDGSFENQGALPAGQVEEAALKLNALANEALVNGKPVLSQCHGASLPVFWKVEGSSTSLLSGEFAAGYPEVVTGEVYAANGVTLRADDKVVVASPNSLLQDGGNGRYKIITSRDWYPQTVAHAARVFLNVLESYPDVTARESTVKVLIMHGGAIDQFNCTAGNRNNDVPCNYGAGIDLPADYSHIKQLLEANHTDNFQFVVTDLNLTGVNLPYSPDNQSSIENYLNSFDVIVFFKHWSTGVNITLQNAILSFADNGGGVLGLHHAMYNDIDDANPSLNKNILNISLFGVTSEESNWSATRGEYLLYSTNYGHFVSTYNVDISQNIAMQSPATWDVHPLMKEANKSLSVYQTFSIFDEVYNNKVFYASEKFGYGVNEITPLFSNNLAGEQIHTEGFVKLYNKNADTKIGKVACFQPGENRENFELDSTYGQIVRNAVLWLSFN